MKEFTKKLKTIKGFGDAKAKALYDAGFTSLEAINDADEDDLASVKGIGAGLASKLKEGVKGMLETQAEKPEAPAEQGEQKVIAPQLDKEKKRLLAVRKVQKSAKPDFRQSGAGEYKKLSDRWNKPTGLHNKVRYASKGKVKLVEIGYGSPALVRGLHPSGFREVIVRNAKELDALDAKLNAARIAGSVGKKKRIEITKRAGALGLRVLNPVKEG
ncbi:MAG TPA: 50S ribosomal protein L32e [Candidatus Methanoperedenaceae archaeon]|nr:50S ribosomal protein L32e [Candidatus Methanoperedenaceae archaeon]